MFVKVTDVLCPVGLRMVRPGYVPPYVHIFVHGPSRIWTHPSLMPIDTFAFVFTGGKRSGCENPAGVDAAVRGAVIGDSAILGALPDRNAIAAKPTASTQAMEALTIISASRSSHESRGN